MFAYIFVPACICSDVQLKSYTIYVFVCYEKEQCYRAVVFLLIAYMETAVEFKKISFTFFMI